MNQQIKFSIIVPVYNTQKYIKRCIQSVISQQYDNYELILINDGSIDDSGIICEQYSSKYDNITYFFKDNGGPASARNVGLDNATGDYLLFLDSDDRMCEDLLYKLNDIISEEKCDIYFGMSIYYYEHNNMLVPDKQNYNNEILKNGSSIDVLHDILHHNILFLSVWRHTFKRNFIEENNIRFDETLIGPEDGDFVINTTLSAKTYGSAMIPFCYYTDQRENSIVSLQRYVTIKSYFLLSIKWYLYVKKLQPVTNNDSSLYLISYFANSFLDAIASSGRLKKVDREKLKELIIEHEFIMKDVKGINKKVSLSIYRTLRYINAAPILRFLYRVNSKIKNTFKKT
ncbi:MAG: glycosyltransferase [Oscillospiraceae bacterium]|nr:glycosyltransferase [Oscillospiraceae bacterium]